MYYAGTYILLFSMNFLEKNLEQIIYETDNTFLNNRGLEISGRKLRQVRIGNYGIADIVTFERKSELISSWDDVYEIANQITISIYELKKDLIDMNTLSQACRYKTGINEYINKYKYFKPHNIQYNIYLVGSSIQLNGEFVYVCESIENCKMYTYNYDIDGISFEMQTGYHLSNPGF